LKVSVVVPTFNEAENIGLLVERLRAVLPGVEVVVVDDGSPDGTAEVASSLPGVVVIRRPRKLGLGSAVREGARRASADIVVVMDADLQHPPEVVPRLVEALAKCGADVAVASRYMEGGYAVWGSPVRLAVSRLSALAVRLLIPGVRGVRDPLSGFFACRRGLLLTSAEPGYKVLLDLLTRRRLRVVEVPYVFEPRRRGASKLSVEEAARFTRLILRLICRGGPL